MAKARMLGTITKIDEQDDGTLMVEGIASTPALDSDGESFTAECMKACIPDYMEKRRALREMHQNIAAGTTKEMWVDADGATRIVAHVVDPVSVLKVQTGVLKMFSIQGVVPPGGRDKANRKIINKLQLREVSLVDVGANPEAMVEVVKLDSDPVEVAVEVPAVVEADAVEKGLYSVANFASLLTAIGYQIQDAQWEADCEGDKSPIPAALHTWLASGAEILKAMTEEETTELLASLAPPVVPVVEVIALAEHTDPEADNVEKAGAKFSAATKSKLAEAHDHISKAADCMKSSGYDDAKKVDAPAPDEDTIAKVAGLEDSVTKISVERDALKDTVTKLQTEATAHQASLDQIVKSMKEKGYLISPEKGKEGDISKAAGVEAEPTEPLDVMRKCMASGPTIHPRA